MNLSKKDLAPMTFPKIPPEKGIDDFIQSKLEDEHLKKFPDWDLARLGPMVEMVAARRDLFDVEQRLTTKRKEAEKRRQESDAQWQELGEKEELLKQSFIKFNKFVKENQEKRERAEGKTADEIALQEKREADIVELQDKFDNMYDVKGQMEQYIKEYKMYEDYLQTVAKAAPIFKSVNDILNRYEALAEARTELAARQERDLSALEHARTVMLKLVEEKTLQILGLNNQVANLLSRYENAKNKALQWEMIVTTIKKFAVNKLAELCQVREATWYIYLQMCKRKEIEPEIEEHDIEKQLVFIKSTLLELKRITKVAEKKAQVEYGSMKAENVTANKRA